MIRPRLKLKYANGYPIRTTRIARQENAGNYLVKKMADAPTGSRPNATDIVLNAMSATWNSNITRQPGIAGM